MPDRVVITGLGVISSIGLDVQSFWRACLDGCSEIALIPEQWRKYSDYNSGIWSPLPELDYKALGFIRTEIMQRDPVSLIAMAATEQALDQAGLFREEANPRCNQYYIPGIDSNRFGVFVGTGIGGANSFLDNQAFQMLSLTKSKLTGLLGETTGEARELLDLLYHPRRLNPFVVSMLMPNAVSATIGIKYSLHGPNRTIAQACSSGTSAIGSAFRCIRSGDLDYALCGGAEYLYDPYGGIYRGFDIANTLARPGNDPETANRPFCNKRSGFLYSEGGAGMLLIERECIAKSRNAEILAEVAGFGESFDASSMMSNAGDGRQIERMIENALGDAGIQSSDIDYINTHGTGTQINDDIESRVLEGVFHDRPIVNSTKSILGHTIGASGAIEAITSVLSLQHQTTHICKNLDEPIAKLNFVKEVAPHNITHALSESFAFGGHNSALILKRYE